MKFVKKIKIKFAKKIKIKFVKILKKTCVKCKITCKIALLIGNIIHKCLAMCVTLVMYIHFLFLSNDTRHTNLHVVELDVWDGTVHGPVVGVVGQVVVLRPPQRRPLRLAVQPPGRTAARFQ